MANGIPVSWQLLQAIQTQLQTIVTPTYRTNIGASVVLELGQVLDTGNPSVSINLVSETRREQSTQSRRRDCEVLIECLVAGTSEDAQREAHDALEDTLEIFPALTRITLSGGATADVDWAEGRVAFRPDGADAVVAQATLRCTVNETL